MTCHDETRPQIGCTNTDALERGAGRVLERGMLVVCIEVALLMTNCGGRSQLERQALVLTSAQAGSEPTDSRASTGGTLGTIHGSGGHLSSSNTTTNQTGGVTAQPNGGGTSATTDASGCSMAMEVVGTFNNYSMPELSGIAASRDQPGLLYAQADSGSAPEVVAFALSGDFIGSINLDGAVAVDWEDIAIGAQSEQPDYIYVADTGDNNARDGLGARESIQIYRLAEPEPWQLSDTSALSSNWEAASYRYPTMACDAEAIFVDPQSGEPYLVTKANDGHSDVYRAPLAAFAQNEISTLEWVADFSIGIPYEYSALITAADISPDGDRVLLRTYTSIYLYARKATWQETFAEPVLVMDAPAEPQGEGITFDADAGGWFSASELSATLYHGSLSCP